MITQHDINYYSIKEINNYIQSRDSLGDVVYFLNDENIQAANAVTLESVEDIEESEDDLDDIIEPLDIGDKD